MEEKLEEKVEAKKALEGTEEPVTHMDSPNDGAFPNIRRMIASLDKFLSKRIAVIGAIYLCAMILCGAGLIINGVTANAATGQGANPTTNTWLYATIATASFIFILIVVRVIAVRMRIAKEKS